MNEADITAALLMALECFFIMVTEMFAWEKKGGSFFPEPQPGFFEKTKTMAANQGLYNGFLGAGMIFSLFSDSKGTLVFFLCCMTAAGVFGALSVTRSIALKQAAPAAAALAVVLLI